MGNSLIHRFVEVNGVRLHIAEQGQGPLILLLHGWPESWYSWRHQFGPLAAAGYRVVAPDQRGYARSEQPPDVASYTLLHLVGDVIALIEKLGEEQAVVVGHDWGAPVAWAAAMLRPDKVRAVAGLSIPPILPGGMVPASLTEEDIQAYAEDFALHGEQAFTGAFNWYRNIERNNELLAPFRGRGIDVPALYVVGDRDMVTSLRGPDGGPSLSAMLRGQGGSGNPLSAVAPQLHGPVVLPG